MEDSLQESERKIQEQVEKYNKFESFNDQNIKKYQNEIKELSTLLENLNE